jgi:phospholipase C
VVNSPAKKWFTQNDAETIFERLERHGKTWKIYVMEPMSLSFHGVIHYSRLKDRAATHIVPFAEFERDAAAGTLPDFSLIEPNFIAGHGDYHPAFGRSFGQAVDATTLDPPSSVLGGEAFLARTFDIYRSSTSESGSNVWNTTLLIGWDEPGAPTTTSRLGKCLRPIRTHLPASWASRSTAPATAFRRSSSHPGSSKARSSTTSTATPH